MKKWKVKYQYIPDRLTRHPFFKRENEVDAETRKEAIDKVKQTKCFLEAFDRWSASPIKENESE